MVRPPLPIGTSGRVRTYRTPSGWRARTSYRDYDGVTREVEKHGRTKAAAERLLATAVRDRAYSGGGAELSPDSRVSALAEAWYAEAEHRGLSPATMAAYRHQLDRHILTPLGDVRVRELTVGVVDRHLHAVTAKHGNAVAKTCRSVLSGMCSFACRRDLLDHNPVREVSRISVKPQKATVAMDVEAIVRLRKWLVEDAQSVSRDLPDLISFLAATGCRIGEALALRWQDVDLDQHTIEVRGTVLRIKGGGLIIKSSPKTAAGQRLVELPSWAIAMLRDRRDLAVAAGAVSVDDLQVFPAPQAGGLRDPSNTQKVLRSTFERAGFPGLTSHAFRAALGTLMDQSGRTARNVADQLGHSKPSFSQDRYMLRKLRDTGAAQLLEQLGGA